MKRVIAGHGEDGKSHVIEELGDPLAVTFETIPGLVLSDIWRFDPVVSDLSAPSATLALDAQPGEAILRLVRVPPEPEILAKFVAEKVEKELREKVLGEISIDPNTFGLHQTNTFDFVYILSGEIVLVLDRNDVVLKAGDSVLQLRSRHSWRNHGPAPCLMLAAMTSYPD